MSKNHSLETALRRGAARLAAVQALYTLDVAQGSVDDAVRDFLNGKIGGEVIEEDLDLETETVVPLIELNAEMFSLLVRGVAAQREQLDEAIRGFLSEGWDADRLQPVLRNILRCGLFELMERPDVPPRVAIAEYVDMARSFYDGPEAGMVNAVLDRSARQLRAGEMDSPRRPRSSS